MYSDIFGTQPNELVSEFDRLPNICFDEMDEEIKQAPIDKPYQFCQSVKQSTGEERKIMDFKTGTTTLAFVFKEGIIMAVDSRATMGNFISSETVRKVI